MKINDYNRLVNLHANSLLGLVQLKPEQGLTDGQRSNARIMEDMSDRATSYVLVNLHERSNARMMKDMFTYDGVVE